MAKSDKIRVYKLRLAPVQPYDVAIYILDKKKATWTDLENYFVKGPKEVHISRQTLSEYLKELIKEGLVTKTIDKESLRPVYIVKDEERIERIRWIKETQEKINQALENNDLATLQKILDSLITTSSSLRGELEVVSELDKRALIRLPKYLFGITEKEVNKYLDEFIEEGAKVYLEKLAPKLPDGEQRLIKRGKPFTDFSERYEGIDGFIIWLIEKKGLKPRLKSSS